jgi:hypothetical protein
MGRKTNIKELSNMNFSKAKKIVEANQHLIGKQWKGAIIDEIIIAPTDSSLRNIFEKMYLQTLNAQQSIKPFINSDVNVIVVYNKKMIDNNGVMFYGSINDIPEEYDVKL